MNITLRKLSFLLCFLCFAGNALAQSHVTSANDLYTFETIAVEGVDYLAVGASSDFEDYAGNTPSPDGERMIGFTLIDGVFKTYAPVPRTSISTHSAIMELPADTMRITMGFIMVSLWKMGR